MWNENFELPQRLNSVSGVQDYFEYITNNYEIVTDNQVEYM